MQTERVSELREGSRAYENRDGGFESEDSSGRITAGDGSHYAGVEEEAGECSCILCLGCDCPSERQSKCRCKLQTD